MALYHILTVDHYFEDEPEEEEDEEEEENDVKMDSGNYDDRRSLMERARREQEMREVKQGRNSIQ